MLEVAAAARLGVDHRDDAEFLWEALQDARRASKAEREGPAPRWIEKCREVLGNKIAKFIHDDGNTWDVFTLTSILKG